MPSLAYNPDDHIEAAENDNDERIRALMEKAQLREGSEYVSDIDIPFDDELDDFTESESPDEKDTKAQEPASEIFSDDVSEMEDKPYDGGAVERIDTSQPLSFDAEDELLTDDNLFM